MLCSRMIAHGLYLPHGQTSGREDPVTGSRQLKNMTDQAWGKSNWYDRLQWQKLSREKSPLSLDPTRKLKVLEIADQYIAAIQKLKLRKQSIKRDCSQTNQQTQAAQPEKPSAAQPESLLAWRNLLENPTQSQFGLKKPAQPEKACSTWETSSALKNQLNGSWHIYSFLLSNSRLSLQASAAEQYQPETSSRKLNNLRNRSTRKNQLNLRNPAQPETPAQPGKTNSTGNSSNLREPVPLQFWGRGLKDLIYQVWKSSARSYRSRLTKNTRKSQLDKGKQVLSGKTIS